MEREEPEDNEGRKLPVVDIPPTALPSRSSSFIHRSDTILTHQQSPNPLSQPQPQTLMQVRELESESGGSRNGTD